jgi:hypothetical protein
MKSDDRMSDSTVYELRDGNSVSGYGTLDDISESVARGAKCTAVVSVRDRSSARFKVVPHGGHAALLYVPSATRSDA